jgi:hypothetical protein
MPWFVRGLANGWREATTALMLLLLAAPVSAADLSWNVGLFEWNRYWSLTRLLLSAALLVVWGFLCFRLLFPVFLAPGNAALDRQHRSLAPWPLTALGRSLALFWLLAWATFLFFFGIVSSELRPGSASTSLLEKHWPWVAVAAAGLLGAVAIALLVRHPKAADAK